MHSVSVSEIQAWLLQALPAVPTLLLRMEDRISVVKPGSQLTVLKLHFTSHALISLARFRCTSSF